MKRLQTINNGNPVYIYNDYDWKAKKTTYVLYEYCPIKDIIIKLPPTEKVRIVEEDLDAREHIDLYKAKNNIVKRELSGKILDLYAYKKEHKYSWGNSHYYTDPEAEQHGPVTLTDSLIDDILDGKIEILSASLEVSEILKTEDLSMWSLDRSDNKEYNGFPLCILLEDIITINEFTVDGLLDTSNYRMAVGDTVDVLDAKGKVRYSGILRGANEKSGKVADSTGKTKSAVIRRVVKSKNQPKILASSLDTFPDKTICDNIKNVMESDQIKVVELKDIIVQTENRTTKQKAFKCLNCGVETAIGEPCMNCKQTHHIIDQKEDKALIVQGPKPVHNNINLQEARCCDNCSLMHFEYGRHGKRTTGYCTHRRLAVKVFNTCESWFPQSPNDYASELKGSMGNLNAGVGRYQDKNNEDLNFTVDMKEKVKNNIAKAKVDYERSYNFFIEELKKKHGF